MKTLNNIKDYEDVLRIVFEKYMFEIYELVIKSKTTSFSPDNLEKDIRFWMEFNRICDGMIKDGIYRFGNNSRLFRDIKIKTEIDTPFFTVKTNNNLDNYNWQIKYFEIELKKI